MSSSCSELEGEELDQQEQPQSMGTIRAGWSGTSQNYFVGSNTRKNPDTCYPNDASFMLCFVLLWSKSVPMGWVQLSCPLASSAHVTVFWCLSWEE